MSQIPGVLLWLVAISEAAIRHQSSPPLSFAVLCMLRHACGESRVWRAPRKKKGSLVIWSNGHDAQFGFDGESSSLAEFMSIFVSTFFFLYYVRNPDTTDNRQHTSSARCVLQPAGYNALHACRLPAEQEATPHACGSLSALYYCCAFLFSTWFRYRTLRSVGLRVCCCVMHAATGTPTQIFHNVI